MSDNRPPSPPASLGCLIVILLEWLAICSLLMLIVTGVLKPVWSQDDTARRPASTRVIRQEAATATFAPIAAAEPSPILEAPTPPAEPSATIEPSPTAAPTLQSEPTIASLPASGLGVSRSKLMLFYEEAGYVFEEGMLTNINVPYALGRHAVTGSTIDILGPPEDVLRASVAVSVDWLSTADEKRISSASLILLLVQVLPDWKEGSDWLISKVASLSESDSDTPYYETIIDGKKISLQAERLLIGVDVTLTIESVETEVAEVVAPTLQPGPTATNTPQPTEVVISKVGGLGLLRSEWEAMHGSASKLGNLQTYEDQTYFIIFRHDRVWHLERDWKGGIDIGAAEIYVRSLIPQDSIFVERYTSTAGRRVDVYTSELLKGYFPDQEAWLGEEPGTFIVIYRASDGPATGIVAALGNNP